MTAKTITVEMSEEEARALMKRQTWGQDALTTEESALLFALALRVEKLLKSE